MKKELTHINKDGHPGMVDVSDKATTIRVASASGNIILGNEIMKTTQNNYKQFQIHRKTICNK